MTDNVFYGLLFSIVFIGLIMLSIILSSEVLNIIFTFALFITGIITMRNKK